MPPQTERSLSLSHVNGEDNSDPIGRQFATNTPPVSVPDAHDSEIAQGVASADKPLPEIPQVKPFTESRTLYTSFNLGFPKRPKHTGHRRDGDSSLPDGLFKASIPLQKTMLPSIDWGGISVKVSVYCSHAILPADFTCTGSQYYLDVSVTGEFANLAHLEVNPYALVHSWTRRLERKHIDSTHLRAVKL
jgi:hypothetical protein